MHARTMSETHGDRRIFTLQEVANSIRKTISQRYGSAYWVRAEINKLNHYPHSGHCFPELVEKQDGQIVAEMRSVLWAGDYNRINRHFMEVVKEPLKDGVTVLMLTSIQFDPVYGLSLKIHDIDPAFSLGQLEVEKRQTIARLKKEGVFDANKQHAFPLLPKRLAVVSVESSKGYADFLQIIQGNAWDFHFEITLFPALLQGDRSVASIRRQLEAIQEIQDQFDVALIIRGGGGDVGLSSYNQYDLAAAIANFPLPVMTGIGHSTNETVSEMVAYRSAITPSELADFLIQHFVEFAGHVADAERTLTEWVPNMLRDERLKLEKMALTIRHAAQQGIFKQRDRLTDMEWLIRARAQNRLLSAGHELAVLSRALRQALQTQIRENKRQLKQVEEQIHLLDPQQVLKRGFSITFDEQGRLVMDPAMLQAGDRILTQLAGGTIRSQVTDLDSRDDKGREGINK